MQHPVARTESRTTRTTRTTRGMWHRGTAENRTGGEAAGRRPVCSTERDQRHCCCEKRPQRHLLCLSSGSASFRGAFQGQLRNYAVRRLSQSEGSSRCSPQMLLLFPVFGGCTATILRGLTYPKILCTPEKEDRKRENGDIAWRRSLLLMNIIISRSRCVFPSGPDCVSVIFSMFSG